jgi:hypothetical protein
VLSWDFSKGKRPSADYDMAAPQQQQGVGGTHDIYISVVPTRFAQLSMQQVQASLRFACDDLTVCDLH